MYKDFSKKELIRRIEQQDVRYKQMVLREHELMTELSVANNLIELGTKTMNDMVSYIKTKT